MPIRGEALHPHEGVARHVGHDLQRERHDRLQADQAQDHRGQTQRHDAAEGRERRMARIGIRGAGGQRVDEMAGKHRHEEVGHGRAQQAAGHRGGAARLLQPVAEHEGNHHADGGGTFFSLGALGGHGVIRLRSGHRPAPL